MSHALTPFNLEDQARSQLEVEQQYIGFHFQFWLLFFFFKQEKSPPFTITEGQQILPYLNLLCK